MGQIKKKWSFTHWVGLRGAPRGRDEVRKFSHHAGRAGMGETKPFEAG